MYNRRTFWNLLSLRRWAGHLLLAMMVGWLTLPVQPTLAQGAINRLSPGDGTVSSVTFSPDGRYLACGSGGSSQVDKDTVKYWGAVKLWDMANGQLLATLQGHSEPVKSVAFSPDGKYLASGDTVAGLKLWEVVTGRLHIDLKAAAYSVAFSPDSKHLASVATDNMVKLWDVATGELLKTLEGHSAQLWSVAFSPDGKWLASGSEDRTVKVWDAATGQLRATFQGHSGGVMAVAFSPDGKWLASGSGYPDNTVKLWDVATGQLLTTLKGHEDNRVNSVAFSPDGKWLASGSLDQTVKLWDATTGKLLAIPLSHSHEVNSVAFSPDGTLLAAGSYATVKLWDSTGKMDALYLEILNRQQYVSEHPDDEEAIQKLIDITVIDNGQSVLVVGQGIPPDGVDSSRALDLGRRAALVDMYRWLAYYKEWAENPKTKRFGSVSTLIETGKGDDLYTGFTPDGKVIAVKQYAHPAQEQK